MTLKKTLSTFFLSIFVAFGLTSCGSDDKKLKEQSELQSKVASQEAVNANNENTKVWARALEADLLKQHRFYRALEGTFEGTYSDEEDRIKVRIRLVSTLPYLDPNRTRTIEEIVLDKSRIGMDLFSKHINIDYPLAVGNFVIKKRLADFEKGSITFTEKSVPLYEIHIMNKTSSITNSSDLRANKGKIQAKSKLLSKSVRTGKIPIINKIFLELDLPTDGPIKRIVMDRVQVKNSEGL